MAHIIMIVPPERFRDEELFVTQEELEKAGHRITIASTRIGIIHGSRGESCISEIELDDINSKNYDAVVFVGGGGSKLLFANKTALRIAKEMYKQNKVVAAICLAPVILANAGILNGKKATVAGTEAKTLEKKGAIYTGPGVTVDGTIVTGNAPKASHLFGQQIANVLHQKEGL